MRFRATVLSLILLLASVSLLAESLPDFSRRVLALRGRTPTLETAKYVLDSTTEGLMTDLSLINEVSTPGGAIGIELSWINDIVQDLR
ncbi:MAG TPA: hypothetical protein PKO06_24800, partial [Candidatus Ozemobacteraceae bacterium]|nr:hypothetical protein [Candidatus Ozemobacteraceae bacterium]